ncbi:unnamed protein product [Caenorhabditis auriculariae]|uniref:Uncharacterized protein n=1 Tax=Caenorhabditis auriculariae TaxID=2777116 RepID=A0A8S1HQ22_9PELO|nr:unnamed protein product [Caenorhabditis auriculariae]
MKVFVFYLLLCFQLYSGSTTSSGPINYCMQRPWKTSFNREAKASQFATTICQLNYPKADSCQYWRIASIVMLDANTPQPIALLNSITNFLNKAAVNCNSKSKMQVFTPDLARDINQTVPMYSLILKAGNKG